MKVEGEIHSPSCLAQKGLATTALTRAMSRKMTALAGVRMLV